MSSHPKNLIAGIDITKPILKGHLFKQAHLHQSFNKRYFVLYPKVLVYYDHEHNFLRDLERGTLEHRDKGYCLDGIYLTKPTKKPQGAKFCFTVHVPSKLNDRKEILLVAENREQKRQWMEKLQDQNPALLEKENGHGHGHEHGHGHRHGHEHGHSHEHGHGSATLEVPRQRCRSDSSAGLHSDETQTLDVREGSSDTEN